MWVRTKNCSNYQSTSNGHKGSQPAGGPEFLDIALWHLWFEPSLNYQLLGNAIHWGYYQLLWVLEFVWKFAGYVGLQSVLHHKSWQHMFFKGWLSNVGQLLLEKPNRPPLASTIDTSTIMSQNLSSGCTITIVYSSLHKYWGELEAYSLIIRIWSLNGPCEKCKFELQIGIVLPSSQPEPGGPYALTTHVA